MLERNITLIILFTILAPSLPSFADQLTLREGTVYSSLNVVRYNGRKGEFEVEKGGKRAAIPGSEIERVSLEGKTGEVVLLEGKSYTDLQIEQFDLPRDRLRVSRLGKTVEVPLSQIGAVRIGSPMVSASPTAKAITQPEAPPSAVAAAEPMNTTIEIDIEASEDITSATDEEVALEIAETIDSETDEETLQEDESDTETAEAASTPEPAAAPTQRPRRVIYGTGGSGEPNPPVQTETSFGLPQPSPGAAPIADWRRRR